MPFHPLFFGGEFPYTKIDYRRKGTLIRTSILEDLAMVDRTQGRNFWEVESLKEMCFMSVGSTDLCPAGLKGALRLLAPMRPCQALPIEAPRETA